MAALREYVSKGMPSGTSLVFPPLLPRFTVSAVLNEVFDELFALDPDKEARYVISDVTTHKLTGDVLVSVVLREA